SRCFHVHLTYLLSSLNLIFPVLGGRLAFPFSSCSPYGSGRCGSGIIVCWLQRLQLFSLGTRNSFLLRGGARLVSRRCRRCFRSAGVKRRSPLLKAARRGLR